MLQYTDRKFKQDNDPTVGVEFGSKVISVGGNIVKLQIWDTVNIRLLIGWTRELQKHYPFLLQIVAIPIL